MQLYLIDICDLSCVYRFVPVVYFPDKILSIIKCFLWGFVWCLSVLYMFLYTHLFVLYHPIYTQIMWCTICMYVVPSPFYIIFYTSFVDLKKNAPIHNKKRMVFFLYLNLKQNLINKHNYFICSNLLHG